MRETNKVTACIPPPLSQTHSAHFTVFVILKEVDVATMNEIDFKVHETEKVNGTVPRANAASVSILGEKLVILSGSI